MKWTSVVLLVGCASTPDEMAAPDAGSGVHLPSDGRYVAKPPDYPTPQACVEAEPNPWSCVETLTLCANGSAAFRLGDATDLGTYGMTNSLAAITFPDVGLSIQFDVERLQAPTDPGTEWRVDTDQLYNTELFDSISCN